MANTKTSKSTAKKGATTKTDSAKISKLEKLIEEQQKQAEEQQKKIETLMAMLLEKEESTPAPAPAPVSDEINAEEEYLVISLTPNKLNLVGAGGEVLFVFDDMYEEQYIDYASLKEIVRVNRDMAKNGRFYILDERVVNKLRLKNNYKNILSPEQLKEILKSDAQKAIELYKLANKAQQSTIIELVKQAKFRGDGVDMNLLSELERCSGVKLIDIEDATKIELSE